MMRALLDSLVLTPVFARLTAREAALVSSGFCQSMSLSAFLQRPDESRREVAQVKNASALIAYNHLVVPFFPIREAYGLVLF